MEALFTNPVSNLSLSIKCDLSPPCKICSQYNLKNAECFFSKTEKSFAENNSCSNRVMLNFTGVSAIILSIFRCGLLQLQPTKKNTANEKQKKSFLKFITKNYFEVEEIYCAVASNCS